MLKPILIIVASSMLFLTACVPSMNPFYTHADIYFDRNLLGSWADPSEKESWTFEYESDKEYRLTHIDEYGKKGVFEARLFRLDGRSFIDITPDRSSMKGNDFYSGHLFSLHTFVRISLNGQSAEMSCLDPEWLKRALEKDPAALDHAIVDSDLILTDSTRALKAFLVSNLNTPGAFGKPTPLKRKEAAK
jgi:hypothetical protein